MSFNIKKRNFLLASVCILYVLVLISISQSIAVYDLASLRIISPLPGPRSDVIRQLSQVGKQTHQYSKKASRHESRHSWRMFRGCSGSSEIPKTFQNIPRLQFSGLWAGSTIRHIGSLIRHDDSTDSNGPPPRIPTNDQWLHERDPQGQP